MSTAEVSGSLHSPRSHRRSRSRGRDRTPARLRATRRKSLRRLRRPRAILNVMVLSGIFPEHPGDGWQDRALPALAGLAARDARISDFQVHGSASGSDATADRWSDLDLLITAAEPVMVAEDYARQIGHSLSPVFAVGRGGAGMPPDTACGWCCGTCAGSTSLRRPRPLTSRFRRALRQTRTQRTR